MGSRKFTHRFEFRKTPAASHLSPENFKMVMKKTPSKRKPDPCQCHRCTDSMHGNLAEILKLPESYHKSGYEIDNPIWINTVNWLVQAGSAARRINARERKGGAR